MLGQSGCLPSSVTLDVCLYVIVCVFCLSVCVCVDVRACLVPLITYKVAS